MVYADRVDAATPSIAMRATLPKMTELRYYLAPFGAVCVLPQNCKLSYGMIALLVIWTAGVADAMLPPMQALRQEAVYFASDYSYCKCSLPYELLTILEHTAVSK